MEPEVASPRRWSVIAVYMAVNLVVQTLWISYAPISRSAESYYGVSGFAIGALAMVFMAAFLPLSIPASLLIDRRGHRVAVGLGGVVAGLCGVARGAVGPSYGWALLATVGIACTQPLLLNSWTTVAARWFPRRERATAVGLVTLANLVGTGVGMVLPPALVAAHGPAVIGPMQLWIGMAALVVGIAYPLLVTDRPARGDVDLAEHALQTHGMRHALSVGPFRRYLTAIFIGMGIFNGVTQWVADIVAPRGFSATDAGNVGAAMLLGGVLGSVSLAAWSDRVDRRVPFLVAGLALAAPATLGIALASSLVGLLGSAFLLGFFLVSLMPIGMQYAVEITWPTPAGTSNGLVQLCGQAAVVYVALLYVARTPGGSYWPGLALSAALLLVGAMRFARAPESHEHHARASTLEG
ncbi:MFS transporter [Arsenicicoccus sp. oral taxon 190]|uniref:MFS transporter n=1 Tax=Arsenicicoccus sp. oral taxon 190 TaxID=1658671 RepID=UPI000679FB1B|nr:MFS transporter [Arsenicicoccus sp. oral taxon 190]AKT50235.1 hypothetical protein ADJ73_00870 [Arsenicicoccus sp. oral taxon 190]